VLAAHPSYRRQQRFARRPLLELRSAATDEHSRHLRGQRRRALDRRPGIEQAARLRSRRDLHLLVGHVRHVPGLHVGRARASHRHGGKPLHLGGTNRPRTEVHAARGRQPAR
jgi:hypothetical protein